MNEYLYIWEYSVRPEFMDEYCEAYRPGGVWARLFAEFDGYVETILLRDLNNENRFITIDRWKSIEHFKAFRDARSTEFESIDRQCEQYTTNECHLGRFAVVTKATDV